MIIKYKSSSTTPETAYRLEFDLTEDQQLVDWALGLMLKGCKLASVAQLAGAVEPYSHFQLVDWAKYILDDLNLGQQERQTIIDNYIRQTLKDTLRGERSYLEGLKNLYDLCLALNYDDSFMDFYQLYNAKSDLEYSPQQWYWDGATRDNIDEICYDYLLNWLKEHPE